MNRPREQRSLFGEILDWMLAPLLFLWPMSVALTWFAAATISNKPYDREIGQLAQSVADIAVERLATGEPVSALLTLELERAVALILRTSGGGEGAAPGVGDEIEVPGSLGPDRRWVQILGPRGELLAGEGTLPVPFDDTMSLPGVHFRDETLGGEPVRVAAVRLRSPALPLSGRQSAEVLVQVAETLGARSQLATAFVTDLILPQFVILPIAVLLVWLALSRGIRPLAELQARIRRRQSQDLSPIPEGDVPVEVAPLVHAINDLLGRLDRSLAAQRHFLADAAHQLKTPLAGLRTQAELAAREIDSGRGDPAAMRHSLRQIALGSQRAAHMVNQLLAMARAEDQGQVLRRQPLDMAAVVRAVVRDAVPKAMDRGIDLGWEGLDDLAPGAESPEPAGDGNGRAMMVGEPVLLGEMVRNLVDNALQYTPRGGTVTARVRPSGGVWLVQVEDNGPGIALAERERIFQAFYRPLDNPVDGSGLGLAIVKEVAERHGGSVVVDDAFPHAGSGQRGALFTVRLPALLPNRQPRTAG
jgi:two-component system, OmpR family, sensor histidine kinase TctE